MHNKKLGLYNSTFLVFNPDLISMMDFSRYPVKGGMTYYKNKLCRILEYNKDIVTLDLVTQIQNDCIELEEQETSYIKQLCTKYNLEEPECNLQTLNNLVLIENPSLQSLSNITELAASNDEGTIIITTMILLNHDNTTEPNNTSNNS